MKIVYVGPLWEGSTCRMRMRAMQELGHEILPVDTWTPSAERRSRHFLPRFLNKLGYPPDLTGANAKISEIFKKDNPEVLWIDKGLTIKQETIRGAKEKSKRVMIVSYSPDDMAQPHNQSRAYLQAMSMYDVHFTTKSYNVDELLALGARRAYFVGNGYDPNTHKPILISENDRRFLGGGVGFIGDFEDDRARQMLDLAKTGIPVRIWGMNWGHWRKKHQNLTVENRPLWGDDYARAICSFDVNLCFLRKKNRDRQTTRSVEIPACASFMLAERTEEHVGLFEEGQEAEFFSSTDELIEKVQFYLSHEELRRMIAHAGRERCLRSGYDYPSRMRWMLEQAVTECAG